MARIYISSDSIEKNLVISIPYDILDERYLSKLNTPLLNYDLNLNNHNILNCKNYDAIMSQQGTRINDISSNVGNIHQFLGVISGQTRKKTLDEELQEIKDSITKYQNKFKSIEKTIDSIQNQEYDIINMPFTVDIMILRIQFKYKLKSESKDVVSTYSNISHPKNVEWKVISYNSNYLSLKYGGQIYLGEKVTIKVDYTEDLITDTKSLGNV